MARVATYLAILTLAAYAATGTSAMGREKVKDHGLTAASAEALVFLKADRLPFTEYSLAFQRQGARNLLAGGPWINVLPHHTAPYVGRKLPPGKYILNMVVQQRHWANCYGSGTLSFSIEAGRTYYLGAFNAMPVLKDLQEDVRSRGKVRLSRGANSIGWNPKVKPEFVAPSELEVAEFKQWAANNMPKSTALVESLGTIPAQFPMSAGAKAMQVCG